MTKEIGGYIELDSYRLPMLHDDGLLLNCGRSCLLYILKAKNIKKIVIPYYCCDTVREVCIKAGVETRYFSIGLNWQPSDIKLAEDEWLYIVNYFGQLTHKQILALRDLYKNIIVDNAQAYFDKPIEGIDTLYTCRKFFGVADGGILYTDTFLTDILPTDESWRRMEFLLGRYERTASEFYGRYVENNDIFSDEGIKHMSLLTSNLLHGIDYDFIRQRRQNNFAFLHDAFGGENKLSIRVPDGAFAYPLLVENGVEIRSKLIKEKIYIPCLWPNVRDDTNVKSLEYRLADNILPLPVDQRYSLEDMKYLEKIVHRYINET